MSTFYVQYKYWYLRKFEGSVSKRLKCTSIACSIVPVELLDIVSRAKDTLLVSMVASHLRYHPTGAPDASLIKHRLMSYWALQGSELFAAYSNSHVKLRVACSSQW